MMTCDSAGTHSPWSAPAYVTTIAPIEVSVLDVGEDYARLAWKREDSPAQQANAMWLDEAETEYSITLTEVCVCVPMCSSFRSLLFVLPRAPGYSGGTACAVRKVNPTPHL